mgnify:CR=1 FL=1
MKLKFSYVFIFSTILISGCAGKVALLKNQEGDVAKCEVSSGDTMLTGVIIRDMTINNCIEEYEKAGYKKI